MTSEAECTTRVKCENKGDTGASDVNMLDSNSQRIKKLRRVQENSQFDELSALLPVKNAEKLDRSTILRLTLAYFNLQKHMQTAPPSPWSASHAALQLSSCVDEGSMMLDALGGCLMMVDDKCEVLYVTQEVETMLGYTQSDMILNDMREWIHEDDHQFLEYCFKCHKEKNLDKQQINVRMKFQIVTKGKSRNRKRTGYMPVECTVAISQTFSADDVVFLVTCRPIVTVPRADILRFNNVFVTKHRMDQMCTYIDSMTSYWTGYEPHDLEGRVCIGLQHPDDVHVKLKYLQTMFKTGSSVTVPYRCKKKNGMYIWLVCRFNIVYDKSKKPQYFVATHNVISEREGMGRLKSVDRETAAAAMGAAKFDSVEEFPFKKAKRKPFSGSSSPRYKSSDSGEQADDEKVPKFPKLTSDQIWAATEEYITPNPTTDSSSELPPGLEEVCTSDPSSFDVMSSTTTMLSSSSILMSLCTGKFPEISDIMNLSSTEGTTQSSTTTNSAESLESTATTMSPADMFSMLPSAAVGQSLGELPFDEALSLSTVSDPILSSSPTSTSTLTTTVKQEPVVLETPSLMDTTDDLMSAIDQSALAGFTLQTSAANEPSFSAANQTQKDLLSLNQFLSNTSADLVSSESLIGPVSIPAPHVTAPVISQMSATASTMQSNQTPVIVSSAAVSAAIPVPVAFGSTTQPHQQFDQQPLVFTSGDDVMMSPGVAVPSFVSPSTSPTSTSILSPDTLVSPGSDQSTPTADVMTHQPHQQPQQQPVLQHTEPTIADMLMNLSTAGINITSDSQMETDPVLTDVLKALGSSDSELNTVFSDPESSTVIRSSDSDISGSFPSTSSNVSEILSMYNYDSEMSQNSVFSPEQSVPSYRIASDDLLLSTSPQSVSVHVGSQIVKTELPESSPNRTLPSYENNIDLQTFFQNNAAAQSMETQKKQNILRFLLNGPM